MRPRRLALALLAGAGGVALARRRAAGRREHVDLYYADGSMVSLEAGGPAADRLLSLAADGLGAARGA